MPKQSTPTNSLSACLNRMASYLAIRDHSEKEIKQKLRRFFAADIIEKTIASGKRYGWFKEPEELAERITASLNNKNKSFFYIKKYLLAKGLPPTSKNLDLEIKKAFAIIKKQFDLDEPLTTAQKMKVGRILTQRQFDSETIRKMLYDQF